MLIFNYTLLTYTSRADDIVNVRSLCITYTYEDVQSADRNGISDLSGRNDGQA